MSESADNIITNESGGESADSAVFSAGGISYIREYVIKYYPFLLIGIVTSLILL